MFLARSNRGGLAGIAWMLTVGAVFAQTGASPSPTQPPSNESSTPAPVAPASEVGKSQPPPDVGKGGAAPDKGASPAGLEKEAGAPATDAAGLATGQRQGRLTGDAVYVRSGPSQDHYPVTKLNTGEPVTIVGEEGDWIVVAPPAGCFSYIAEQYVDTTDGARGVVNADRVTIRAGSHLVSDRSCIQTYLSKGAEVRIIARTQDGYYRIEPPSGVKLYISRPLVRILTGDEKLDAAPERPSTASSGINLRTSAPKDTVTDSAAPAAASPEPALIGDQAFLLGPDATEDRRRLAALNDGMTVELAKPLAERNLEPLMQGYQQIADSSSDDFARQYAAARLSQIDYMAKLAGSAASLRNITQDLEKERHAYLGARTKVAVPPIPVRAGYDVEGELRLSAVYASAVGPRRYRLVDPKSQPSRTVGYVELDEDLALDMDRLLGRYVGIQAARIRAAEGMVNPVPIYVASKIVVLNPDSSPSAGERPAGTHVSTQAP